MTNGARHSTEDAKLFSSEIHTRRTRGVKQKYNRLFEDSTV